MKIASLARDFLTLAAFFAAATAWAYDPSRPWEDDAPEGSSSFSPAASDLAGPSGPGAPAGSEAFGGAAGGADGTGFRPALFDVRESAKTVAEGSEADAQAAADQAPSSSKVTRAKMGVDVFFGDGRTPVIESQGLSRGQDGAGAQDKIEGALNPAPGVYADEPRVKKYRYVDGPLTNPQSQLAILEGVTPDGVKLTNKGLDWVQVLTLGLLKKAQTFPMYDYAASNADDKPLSLRELKAYKCKPVGVVVGPDGRIYRMWLLSDARVSELKIKADKAKKGELYAPKPVIPEIKAEPL